MAPLKEVVRISRVEHRIGATAILAGIDLVLRGPRLIGVLGPNGAGKTTLLDLLAGLSKPTSGEVFLFGERITPRNYPRRKVGVVLQSEFVSDHMTVDDYAELFAAIYGGSASREKIVDRAKLERRRTTKVLDLSGGEAARLFLAAAVVHEPELLLLDEPTAHLDPESKQAMSQVLQNEARERTILLATHDLAEAESICDAFVFLFGGRVRATFEREELLEKKSLKETFFEVCGARILEDGQSG